jgi:hypothetical protein
MMRDLLDTWESQTSGQHPSLGAMNVMTKAALSTLDLHGSSMDRMNTP